MSPQAIRMRIVAPRKGAQHGMSLLFALLALVSMMLAAVALVRSIDSGSMVLGNLAFKQDATAAADRAAEAAVAWLRATTLDLTADQAGYYSTSQDALDPTGQVTSATNKLAVVNWGDADSCSCVAAGTCSTCTRVPSNEVTYNQIKTRYLITRLCPSAAAAGAGNACAQVVTTGSGTATGMGGRAYGDNQVLKEKAYSPYYRVVVRAVGPRNTVSFTETIVR